MKKDSILLIKIDLHFFQIVVIKMVKRKTQIKIKINDLLISSMENSIINYLQFII